MVGMSQQEIISLFGLRNATVTNDEVQCSCPYSQNHANGDRHPSFRLNTAKGVYVCFGCGEKGNLVKLAQDILGMDRYEAVRTFDVELTPERIEEMVRGGYVPPRQMTPLQMDISRWLQGDRSYWHQRGFTDETIGKWRLGYDSESRRAVVPIFVDGELMGWSKRVTDPSESPKWMHSEGLEKSQILFGRGRFSGDSAIVVEAPLSVIMLDQYGVSNSVATMGCKMSDAQARLIRSSYNTVLIWYDPDDAGQNGTVDAVDKLKDFVDVYVVPPTRDDPAAMSLEEDLAALRTAVPSWAATWLPRKEVRRWHS